MAGTLNIVYSIVVLLVALVGTAFVFTRPVDEEGESNWSRWGELAAVALFLVAMVAALLVGT